MMRCAVAVAALAVVGCSQTTTSSNQPQIIVTNQAAALLAEARQSVGPDVVAIDSKVAEAQVKTHRDVICRDQTIETGSRLGTKRRLCATRAEWETLEADSRKTTEDLQGSGKYSLGRGG